MFWCLIVIYLWSVSSLLPFTTTTRHNKGDHHKQLLRNDDLRFPQPSVRVWNLNTWNGYLCSNPCQWCKAYGQKSTTVTLVLLNTMKQIRINFIKCISKWQPPHLKFLLFVGSFLHKPLKYLLRIIPL